MKNTLRHEQPITIPHTIRESLYALLDYVHADEQRSYEEAEQPENHIFRHILHIEDWLAERA